MSRLVVVWRVTERCNLSCPFCAYDRTQPGARVHADESLIRQFGTILAAWQQHTKRPVLVSWLGGEPLLWPALTSLTETFHRDHGFAISTTTNGTTLHQPAVRRRLLEQYAELTISVDGLAPTHNALRGQPGLWHQLQNSVRLLAAEKQAAGKGPVLRANVVLMRDTITQFPALCQELATWGIEEITCNQLGGIDRPEFYPAHCLLPSQVANFIAQWNVLQTTLAGAGVKLLGNERYLQRLAATANGVCLPVTDCGPGEHFLFISETGIVAPCNFTAAEYGVNIRDISSLNQLLALPNNFAHAKNQRHASACADCHSTQVCAKFTPPV